MGKRNIKRIDYPYFVSLKTKNSVGNRYHHFCGGSILDESSILTAAHS